MAIKKLKVNATLFNAFMQMEVIQGLAIEVASELSTDDDAFQGISEGDYVALEETLTLRLDDIVGSQAPDDVRDAAYFAAMMHACEHLLVEWRAPFFKGRRVLPNWYRLPAAAAKCPALKAFDKRLVAEAAK